MLSQQIYVVFTFKNLHLDSESSESNNSAFLDKAKEDLLDALKYFVQIVADFLLPSTF